MAGWRFVVEECARAGIEVRLAEPAETRMRQDRKRRAKTDKLDARLLRELLMVDRLPESWIASAHVGLVHGDVRAGAAHGLLGGRQAPRVAEPPAWETDVSTTPSGPRAPLRG